MSETDHSCDAKPTSLALPIAVAIMFAWFAHCAADVDVKAGRVHTLEAPANSDLSVHYVGCKGTPTQVTKCYFDHQVGQ